MRAMILAAGRGERMRPLTDTLPKPLLCAGGKPLIVWHLERLAAGGFREVVINHAHLGEKIEAALGDGSRFGLSIRYSPEPPGALETAGGLRLALPLLGSAPFLVINGDIWCDWDVRRARAWQTPEATPAAHLVLVDNPPHHPAGDFTLDSGLLRSVSPDKALTYAGIAVFNPDFFAQLDCGSVLKLRPLLDAGIAQSRLSGEHHAGQWVDVGTPQRLDELDRKLGKR